MCGIFGITISKNSRINFAKLGHMYQDLFLLSESRGKEASGFAMTDGTGITVFKTPYAASALVKYDIFKTSLSRVGGNIGQNPVALIGHSRLVTNGAEQFNNNNQPVIKSGLVGIHNGIIVNEKELWHKYHDEERNSQLDSELILTLLRRFYKREGSLRAALKALFHEIYGTASLALLFNDLNNLLLTTNNGSLYYVASKDKTSLIFASEQFILDTLITKNRTEDIFEPSRVRHLKPKSACLINLDTAEADEVDYECIDKNDFATLCAYSNIIDIREISAKNTPEVRSFVDQDVTVTVPPDFVRHYSHCENIIHSLKRCSKCLLPETFPYIEFDHAGVCNYCGNYKKWTLQPKGSLEEYVEPFRKKDGNPDCIVTFSGGRDSSYGLHYVKQVLKLNPLAYSYDWGMITDLARRNQARLCGKLGIEHILISADIREKRSNIRKNVLAWLKRPSLGTIPLFMAGDKQYFYYANKLREQNKINLVILCENMLETTNFKTGFCGISPTFDKAHTYSMSVQNKLKMAMFYGKEYISNPSYINSSLLDTLGAFVSYYFIPHNYLNIFNYVKWDETIIDQTLQDSYNWEKAPDTNSTWRIGDGTAPFYNYIYYIVAGFTENDTFRSNQIREGSMTRTEGLKLVMEENRPRFDSIKWYCSTIGIDFEDALKSINAIPKLYEA